MSIITIRSEHYIKDLEQKIRFYVTIDTEDAIIINIAPSTTSIIGAVYKDTFLNDLTKKYGEKWLSNKADRGTAVHALIEDAINSGDVGINRHDIEAIMTDIFGYNRYNAEDVYNVVEMYRHFATHEVVNSPSENIETESTQYDSEQAGTIDIIDHDRKQVWDVKSGKYDALTFSHKLQLAGYSILLEDLYEAGYSFGVLTPCKYRVKYEVKELVMNFNELEAHREIFRNIYKIVDWQGIIDKIFHAPYILQPGTEDIEIHTEPTKKKDAKNYITLAEKLILNHTKEQF